MIGLEKEFFQKVKFSPQQVDRYYQNALRDLRIAQQDKFVEVRFTYGYQALLKAGIALIAKAAGAKVRSVAGHHIQTFKQFSRLMNNPDIFVIGNAMRMKRNQDLYRGGECVNAKEVADYLEFIAAVVADVGRKIARRKKAR